MNWKKLKLLLRLHWIKIIIITALTGLLISLIFFVVIGLRAWNETESYLRQSALAMFPFQLYQQIVMALFFGVIYTFMWFWLFMQRGAQSFTQHTKKAVASEELKVTWDDVIGMDEAKQEALEVVRLITDRAAVQKIGGQILRGILMLGPPGCGKTYLAKAIATEANLPFIPMSGSEFVEMFVGVGAGRIRSLFKKARTMAEYHGGCIIFLDELDAVGAQRALDAGFGGTTEHNTTLNQLLVEMDGLKSKEHNIVIIGATNALQSNLDQALMRPGRFDRKIYVDLPNLEDREKLFDYYLRKVKFDPATVKVDRLARITVGNSPAEIANIVQEAVLIAIRHRREAIIMKDINDARERIELGIKRRVKYREEERWQVAYHEAGHAIITYLLVPTQDVFKITITPRGHTGGVTWTPEREEIFIRDKEKLLGRIKTCLGSYAAERIKFGITTAGVDSDFAQAMYTAHSMAWRWGMGKSGLLGNFGLFSDYSFYSRSSMISDSTKAALDADVQDILQGCLREVDDVLRREIALLDRLAKDLVAKEELDYDEIEAIFKEFGKQRVTA